MAQFLSIGPLVFLGRISYGVYLYHWPLFLAVNSSRTGLSGFSLLAVRLLLTLLVAVLSWRFVEEPIRQRRWLRSWRGACATGAAAVGTAVILALATIVPAASGLMPSLDAQGQSSMKPTEVTALRSVGAFGSHPMRFLLLGDSVAKTTGLGLRIATKKRYGVEVIDRGILGCDLDQVPSRLSDQVFGTIPGQNCWSWWTEWPRLIAQFHPEVVGLLIGRFEIADHLYDGKWMSVGEKVWDEHLEGELNRVIKLASAGGAKVVLFTYPYMDPQIEAPNGDPYPENEPSRVTEWNQLLREVAAHHPGVVTTIDLNRILSPGGHYTSTIDGIRVRWIDRVHVTIAGGEWLQPRILPEIAQLGLDDIGAHQSRPDPSQ